MSRIKDIEGIESIDRLDAALARAGVKAIQSLNNSRSLELNEKILLSKEENDEAARLQKQKAFAHGVSAFAIAALNILGASFQNNIGKICSSASQAAPEIARVVSDIKDGSITIRSHAARASDIAAQAITQSENLNNNIISRHVEEIGRLAQKYNS